MANKPAIKICGVTSPEAMQSAILTGATYAGLVFFDRSPRFVSADRAAFLSTSGRERLKMVGLFVDPDDALLDSITLRVGLDFVQLHGHEDAKRVQAIRARIGLPVIKAIRVATREDLTQVTAYENVADWLLFDAKVAGQQGGTGTSFDWSLLRGFRPSRPWMLSGGLNAENIAGALSLLQPDAVDVSSGVEAAPGIKSRQKIESFAEAVRTASR